MEKLIMYSVIGVIVVGIIIYLWRSKSGSGIYRDSRGVLYDSTLNYKPKIDFFKTYYIYWEGKEIETKIHSLTLTKYGYTVVVDVLNIQVPVTALSPMPLSKKLLKILKKKEVEQIDNWSNVSQYTIGEL